MRRAKCAETSETPACGGPLAHPAVKPWPGDSLALGPRPTRQSRVGAYPGNAPRSNFPFHATIVHVSRLLFLLLFAVSACGTYEPVPPPPSPSTEDCPAGVEFAVKGTEAAMGLRVLTLGATNCGAEDLELNGIPSVTVLDAERKPLPVTVRRGAAWISAVEAFDAEPRPVVVRPGESAVTGLLWRNTYTDVSAPPVVGEHLEIAVAAGRPAQVFTPVDTDGNHLTIDLGSTGELGVRPWTAATP